MLWLSLCLAAISVCGSATTFAQSCDFQTATIVDVQTLSPQTSPSSGGTDAPLTADVNRYNLSVKLGDSVYVCRAKTQGAYDLTWAKGKEVPAKVKGSVMYIKRDSGKVTRLSIVRTMKAE